MGSLTEDPDVTPAPDLVPSLRQLIDGATALLGEAGVPSPRVDAIALAEHVLGIDRLVLALPPQIDADFAAEYAALVGRRRMREPLQHLTGTAAFRHLELQVRPGVFVPRPETEMVAEEAIAEARRLVGLCRADGSADGREIVVVDLCSGSGAIAVAVAQEVDGVCVVAMDRSPEAAVLTADNAARHGVRVQVSEGDVRDSALFAELAGSVDVLVSNPPYIPPDAVPIDPEVRDHDPDLALYGGGEDGLLVPRAVIAAAVRLVRAGGLFVMEHAEVQAAAVRADVLATQAFTDVRTQVDLTGRDRMVLARRV